MVNWSRWALVNWSRWAVASVTVVITLGFVWLFMGYLVPPQKTYGRITVDSPEIYTRERLVNDRFQQHAWLNTRLREDAPVQIGSHSVNTERNQNLTIGQQATNAAGNPPATDAATGEISSSERLISEIDYREEIRDLLIENQLDDRHDLNGNSLYKFKFDATVLPGINTQAQAEVNVTLKGTYNATMDAEKDRANWVKLYKKWLLTLDTRLEHTVSELKQEFYNNEFTYGEYRLFLETLEAMDYLTEPYEQDPNCKILIPENDETSSNRSVSVDHNVSKDCIESLLRKEVERAKSANENAAKTEKQQAKPVSGGAVIRDQLPTPTLRRWLNSYFAKQTIKLVLGVEVPNLAFGFEPYLEADELNPLIELCILKWDLNSQSGVFEVQEKVVDIWAIRKNLSEQDFKKIPKRTIRHEYDDYRITSDKSEYKVAYGDYRFLLGGQARYDNRDFKEKGNWGIYSARIEMGLLNFHEKAVKYRNVFTYAVTPKASGDLEVHGVANDSSMGLGGVASGPIKGQFDNRVVVRTMNRKGAVIGWGAGSAQDVEEASFGWIINPRRRVISNTGSTAVQEPSQHALSALVSIPSWWDEIELKITTNWIDPNAVDRVDGGKDTTYTISLPHTYESLENILLEHHHVGPALIESRIEDIQLTACKPGAIIIPGQRLWRSTVVTVGYQVADEISVLPNMKGIIARFRSVENQAGLAEIDASKSVNEIKRPVRVWTSQGTVALPEHATIGIPKDNC